MDGVLNAVDARDGEPWVEWRKGRGRHGSHSFAMCWSPEVVRFVAELVGRGVEVCWLSTWMHWANTSVGPLLGLPQLPVVGDPDAPAASSSWWKLLEVRRAWEADGRPFVWIDDDLVTDDESSEWLASLPRSEFLAISPHWRQGITPKHIRAITAWLASRAEREILGGV